MEVAPGIVHLPLVFLNKHVIETINAYGDRVARKHLVETTAARYWHWGRQSQESLGTLIYSGDVGA